MLQCKPLIDYPSSMKCLVTGGGGFIGSHLCGLLLSAGNEVICVDDFSTGDKRNIKTYMVEKGFQLVEQDITVAPLNLEDKVDRIYHLACPASPIDYNNLPIKTLLTSSHGTKNILDFAVKKKARFLFASTSEVYGDPLEHPQGESYWGNVNSLGPRSCYDEGKRYAESLITNYECEYALDTRIIRLFNTYGPNMRAHDGRVIPNFINQALEGKEITIYGEGEQTRSFCYIDDMITGLIGLMDLDKIEGPVNWGNPSEITIRDLAKTVLRLTGSSGEIVSMPLPQDDPVRRCPDISKAVGLLGFKPEVSLEEGLQRTIDFFRPSVS